MTDHEACLDPRQNSAVRQAMVLGFVEGVRYAGGLFRVEPEDYPKDTEVVDRVLRTSMSMSDIYPALARIAERDASKEEVDAC